MPTPASLRALIAEATALQERIEAARTGLLAEEETRSASFPLSEATGRVKEACGLLEEAAGRLARVRGVRDGSVCKVQWGVCPDHGNTLRGSGGRAWCTDPYCSRRWDYDRVDSPCGEPLTHRVTDAAGGTFLTCEGHAMDAAGRLDGGTVTRLDAAQA